MEIKINMKGATLTAALMGELDHHSAEEVRQSVDTAFERSGCKNILFDFKDVSFMDSSGIGVIIGRYKNAEKRGGRLAVSGMNGVMQRLFNISGLQKIVLSFNSKAEAEKALGGAARG